MTGTINRCLMLLGLVTLAGPAGANTSTWREQSEASFEARGLTGLKVTNSRGLITVKKSNDGRIHLTALKLARAKDRGQALQVARETQLLNDVEGTILVLRVRYPQRQTIRIGFWEMLHGYDFPRVEVRLALEIPEHLTVSLNTTSGDIETEGLAGNQELQNTSGDILIQNARGYLVATTTSGDISALDIAGARLRSVSGDLELDRVGGSLLATTTSGEITIGAAEDTLALASVSGDIRVGKAPHGVRARTTSGEMLISATSGLVRLESSSGDVTVGLQPPLTRADVVSVSGTIHAILAPSLQCALDARSSNGELDVRADLDLKNVTRRGVTGVVRGGTVPVALRSSSGDIVVKTGGI